MRSSSINLRTYLVRKRCQRWEFFKALPPSQLATHDKLRLDGLSGPLSRTLNRFVTYGQQAPNLPLQLTMASATPPPYARTVFDETHRSISYSQGSIASMAIRPNLLGYLVNHSPDTDGSFSICMAGGIGTFISQSLFESIPSEHRPALDTSAAGQSIELLMGGPMTSIGTTFLPFILTTTTGERIRLVLHALVLPNLFMGMFIGKGGLTWLESEAWGPSTNGPRYTFDFGQTGRVEVQGI